MGTEPAQRLAAWTDARLTYDEHGATRDAALPPGYRHLRREVPIGRGRSAFEKAIEGLLGWRMHRDAGLRVVASAAWAAPGVVVVLRAGPGPASLLVPCRVVYRVDAADRAGFAYGTLPGHPETGEEAFTVRLDGDGEVRLRIVAFSRPASVLARAGGPLTRLAQGYVTNRYIRALRTIAGPGPGPAR